MSNATFSRKPLVAAVLTTLAVFSTGAMAADGEQEVRLTVGTGANTVPNTIKDEKTWDEDWAKTFNKDFTNASGKVTINGQNSDKITISKDEANKTAGKLTNKLSSLTLNVGLDVAEGVKCSKRVVRSMRRTSRTSREMPRSRSSISSCVASSPFQCRVPSPVT